MTRYKPSRITMLQRALLRRRGMSFLLKNYEVID